MILNFSYRHGFFMRRNNLEKRHKEKLLMILIERCFYHKSNARENYTLVNALGDVTPAAIAC